MLTKIGNVKWRIRKSLPTFLLIFVWKIDECVWTASKCNNFSFGDDYTKNKKSSAYIIWEKNQNETAFSMLERNITLHGKCADRCWLQGSILYFHTVYRILNNFTSVFFFYNCPLATLLVEIMLSRTKHRRLTSSKLI